MTWNDYLVRQARIEQANTGSVTIPTLLRMTAAGIDTRAIETTQEIQK